MNSNTRMRYFVFSQVITITTDATLVVPPFAILEGMQSEELLPKSKRIALTQGCARHAANAIDSVMPRPVQNDAEVSFRCYARHTTKSTAHGKLWSLSSELLLNSLARIPKSEL